MALRPEGPQDRRAAAKVRASQGIGKEEKMKSSHLASTLFLGLILGLWSTGAAAQNDPVTVDCSTDSLNDAIRTAGDDWGAPQTLYVIGTCEERVTVPRHRVTINGQPEEGGPTAILDGSIINWGSNITIRNIAITGDGFGVRASVGRTRLINVDISYNDEAGIEISGDGVVFLNNSRVQHNNGLAGISVGTGVLVVSNSEITDNWVGIDATMGSIVLNQGTRIEDNISGGVVGSLHTSILANGPVWIERNGENGVKLELDSGLLTRGPVSINDNAWFDVICRDRESSAKFEDGYPGRAWCSDFRW